MSIVCNRGPSSEEMSIVVSNAKAGCSGKVVFATEVVTNREIGERLSDVLGKVVTAPEGSGLPGQTLIVDSHGNTKYVDTFCGMRNLDEVKEEDLMPGEVAFLVVDDEEDAGVDDQV